MKQNLYLAHMRLGKQSNAIEEELLPD